MLFSASVSLPGAGLEVPRLFPFPPFRVWLPHLQCEQCEQCEPIPLLLWFPLQGSTIKIKEHGVLSWGEEGDEMVVSYCFSLPVSHYPELDVKWYHASSPSPFRVWLPHLQETMQVVRETSLASHLEAPATRQ